jgi:hypothetical protein
MTARFAGASRTKLSDDPDLAYRAHFPRRGSRSADRPTGDTIRPKSQLAAAAKDRCVTSHDSRDSRSATPDPRMDTCGSTHVRATHDARMVRSRLDSRPRDSRSPHRPHAPPLTSATRKTCLHSRAPTRTRSRRIERVGQSRSAPCRDSTGRRRATRAARVHTSNMIIATRLPATRARNR